MTTNLRLHSILFLLIVSIGLLIGCTSDNQPERTSGTKKQSGNFSLFESNDSEQDTNRYSYQSVYPGDTINPKSLKIGLDAAMSGDFAKSGVSIWRGMVLAVDEINTNGGLLGRKLQILVKDHKANPARGVNHIQDFSTRDRFLAVMGGMHTPVMLHELPALHDNKIVSLVPWAAGTNIVDNGHNPNYVFRLSVRDAFAGPFLVKKLVDAGYDNPALFLENTGWGRSNREALTEALQKRGLSPSTVSWFNWSEKTFRDDIEQARDEGADIIVFVGNAPEGTTLVKSMTDLGTSKRLPILSHWGITGGQFFENTRSALSKIQLRVLQTRSFLDPSDTEYARVKLQIYCEKFGCSEPDVNNIFAPVGTAHAHDLVHLLGRAVRKANSMEPTEIRVAMENLKEWQGIVRNYDQPFSSTNHEALTMNDLRLTRFDSSGGLVLADLD